MWVFNCAAFRVLCFQVLVVSGLEVPTAKVRSDGRRLYVRLPVPYGLQRTFLDLCLALPHLKPHNIDHPLCQNANR
jgi:hypothetical protein